MLTVQSFTFNPVGENTYVVYNAKGQAGIIDPGMYLASEEAALTKFMEANGLTPVLLLNTHCHLDHIFGNGFVHRTYDLKLHIHQKEKPVLDAGPMQGQAWGLPFDNYDGELIYIEEGQTIRLGEDELTVLFTPGHSPGSISFYSTADKFVISGDVLFQGSVGRTDLPGGDFAVLEQSIRGQLYTLPVDTVVYSGHGGPTTVGEEMRSNPFVRPHPRPLSNKL